MARIKGQKKQKYSLGFIIAILSLLAIVGILTSSLLRNKLSQNEDLKENQEVLGQESSNDQPSPTLPDVNTLVQETFSSTQTVLTEKAVEIKETIIKKVEEEVAKLTQNQIEALKLQICTDWEVITPSDSKVNSQ